MPGYYPDYYPGRFRQSDPSYQPEPFEDEEDVVGRAAKEQQMDRMHMRPEKTIHGNTGFLGDEAPGGLYFRAGTTEDEIRELIRQRPWAFMNPDVHRAKRPESLPGPY
jgi:hypothetical protein